MAWRKKNQSNRSNRNSPKGSNLSTYSYHNARSGQDKGVGRNIKSLGFKHIGSAKKIWLEKFGLIILAVAVMASLISVMYVSSSSRVVIEGGNSSKIHFDYSSEVEKAASKLITNSIFNRDKITIDTSKIDTALEADFPMYSNISITLPLVDHQPIIDVTEAQPVIVLSNSFGRYIINESGRVMLKNVSQSSFNSLQIPKVSYPSSPYLNIGQQVLTTNEVQFVQVIVYELSLKGKKISTLVLVQGTSEMNIYISGQAYYVKLNLENNDPRQQVGGFLAAQHYLMTQNIIPSQYIDVRTDGRIYYQ